MTAAEAVLYLNDTLRPLCRVFPSVDLLKNALDVKDRYKFHFYDALIVAAALDAGCERLYSEDLNHGQAIERLRIENPFVT
jgi:predicted nucleic acid-binding protein